MINRLRNKVSRLLDLARYPYVINRVHADSLTYISKPGLSDLHEQVKELDRDGREGILVEAGCALGGSAITIASSKSKERPLYVYDVFGMIPPPSEKDGADVQGRYRTIRDGRSKGLGGNRYYGYEEDLLSKVKENFRRHGLSLEQNNVHLIQGRFEDTLFIDEPVALAHLDGDWYDSTMTCLKRIWPKLVVGGTLVIDDYGDWSGCRGAVDDFFSGREQECEYVFKTALHVNKRNEQRTEAGGGN